MQPDTLFVCISQSGETADTLAALRLARSVGYQHTLTVWESERAMRRFLYQGAHKQAIKAFPDIATGKTFGFETDRVPSWDEVPTLWAEHGREYEI